MNASVLEKYVDKVYAYAVRRTFTDDEAGDLSQEILLTALKTLPKLHDKEKFEPWFWRIAENVTKSFSRRMGKQRAMFSYDIPDIPDDEPDDDFSEEYGVLREKIAYLSKIYREITVLYYYDGLSIKNIAERLKIPEGTVTWRLSEARRKIKKEFDDMEESALRPGKLRIDIYGTGNYDGIEKPFPSAYVNDALSQNILLYCYDEPRSIEEIAKYTGVPAYYVEDRVENLVRRNAVACETKGKYFTDFLIFDDSYGIFCEQNAEKTMLPVADKVGAALKKIAEETYLLDHFKGEQSKSDLFYLYAVLTLDYISHKRQKKGAADIEQKYDGYRWNYIGFNGNGKHEMLKFAKAISMNTYHPYVTKNGGKSYKHTVYNSVGKYRRMMYDYQINACVDILTKGSTDLKNDAASAIKDGYIVRNDDGTMKVKIPAFTSEQLKKINEIIEKNFSPVSDDFFKRADIFFAEYKKVFPKRFLNDAYHFTSYSAIGMVIIDRMTRLGEIAPPSNDYVCDVLTEM